jgi:MoxR-like ATPase
MPRFGEAARSEDDALTAVAAVLRALDTVVVGKASVSRRLLCGLLAGGHVLIEDVPGVGKTLMARTLARLLALQFSRVQCTPDMLPGDLLGSTVWDAGAARFTFHPGPVFAHLLVVDELNRTSPRTQAALLEVMEEGQVTVDGRTHALEPPFMVVATQNPMEYEGTFPLPESELDRFMLRLSMGYPDAQAERQLLARTAVGDAAPPPAAALEPADVLALQRAVRRVTVSDAVVGYLVDIIDHTRHRSDLLVGASPRAGQALLRASQAWAFLDGRSYVVPDDIQELAVDVLSHRLLPRLDGADRTATAARAVAAVLEAVPVPRGSVR